MQQAKCQDMLSMHGRLPRNRKGIQRGYIEHDGGNHHRRVDPRLVKYRPDAPKWGLYLASLLHMLAFSSKKLLHGQSSLLELPSECLPEMLRMPLHRRRARSQQAVLKQQLLLIDNIQGQSASSVAHAAVWPQEWRELWASEDFTIVP